MNRCRQTGDELSAYLDTELSPERIAAVENHLDSCPACRADLEELKQTRTALGLLFTQMHAEAPQPNTKELLGTFNRRRRWIRIGSVICAAAVVILVLGITFFLPGRVLDAAELVRVAASRTFELRNAECFISIGFGPANADEATAIHLRLLAEAPGRFVMHQIERPRSGEPFRNEIIGRDGRESWSFDASNDEVVVGDSAELTLRSADGSIKMSHSVTGDHFILHALTWNVFESLSSDTDREIIETTDAATARTGRRTFRIAMESKEEGLGSALISGQVDVTVDPEMRLIEKVGFETRILFAISLCRVELALGEVNQDLPDEIFDYRHYAPPETPVMELTEEE